MLYDDEHADLVRFRLDLAVASANGTTRAIVSQLEAELAALPEPTARLEEIAPAEEQLATQAPPEEPAAVSAPTD